MGPIWLALEGVVQILIEHKKSHDGESGQQYAPWLLSPDSNRQEQGDDSSRLNARAQLGNERTKYHQQHS